MKAGRIVKGLMLAMIAVAGCATEPTALDRTQPEAMNKKMFDGEWIYKMTVVDTDYANPYTFIGEETSSYEGSAFKLRWEITKDYLTAYRIPQRYRDKEGNLVENLIGSKSPILSFKIEKHYDIRYRYNSTTREDLNVIEENTDRPWDEREYMEVDWSQNLVPNLANPMMLSLSTGEIERVPVSVYENVEFFTPCADCDTNPPADMDPNSGEYDVNTDSRKHDVKIDTRKWNPETDPAVYAINIHLKEIITTTVNEWWQLYYGPYTPPVTVKSLHSLVKATPIDQVTYKPLQYPDEMFTRFGYFRTEYEVYDAERGSLENQTQYLANRWDLSGSKKVHWYASPEFQEQIDEGDTQLLDVANRVIEEWNVVLREALDRTDSPLVFHQNEPLMEGVVDENGDPVMETVVVAVLDKDGNPVLDDAGVPVTKEEQVQKTQQVTNLDGSKRWKYELGDVRFSFLSFIKTPQSESPLGYGPNTPDSDTGEMVSATVNVYGNWVDYVVRRVMDQYDVAAGNCTLEQVKAGFFYDPATDSCDSDEFVGEYKGGVLNAALTEKKLTTADSLHILTPSLMSSYYPKANIRAAKTPRMAVAQFNSQVRPTLKAAMKQDLDRRTNVDLNGFSVVQGSRYEGMLIPQSSLKSLLPYAESASDENVIAELSPARRLSATVLQNMKDEITTEGPCKLDATAFEPSINAFVEEMKDKPRMEAYKVLRNWIWYTTALHEMGHTMGLRHNFRGSADQRNFSPEYWDVYNAYWDKVEALRDEYQSKIDAGDANAYQAYVEAVDTIPSTHNRYGSTSIMDYMGDWVKWQYPVGSWDRAAILLAYGNKVEVKNDESGEYTLEQYQTGDFSQEDNYDADEVAASGRKVKYYMFCSDEKVFDDAFCTRFDVGVTATEITRNFIRDAQPAYFFKNFKRGRTAFDASRAGYYWNKWLWTYYMQAKPLAEMTISSIRYTESWDSTIDGIYAMMDGPETREMKAGYRHDGGEDLLRASLIYYYYLMYDVLGRPDYGYYQKSRDTAIQSFWEDTDEAYLDSSKTTATVAAGQGWGWNDKWDTQTNYNQYYEHLTRIGVELDKIIALEILSIPAALNTPLYWEKANGLSFWNSLWTNNGHQLWEVIGGMITDNFSHRQNPWCIKCDANCKADPVANPPQLKAYPVDLLEGLYTGGLMGDPEVYTEQNRCGVDEAPVKPGMDALFAIYPIFYGIMGASHPWYTNDLVEHMDSQVKGGNHRFDIPEGAEVAEFLNPQGTKIYQAVQPADGLGISYRLVKNGALMRQKIDLVDYCYDTALQTTCAKDPADMTAEEIAQCAKMTDLNTKLARTCDEVKACYCSSQFCPPDPTYCEAERWDSLYNIDSLKYSDLERVEAMLIMMQDMVDLAGHYAWRVPGFLEEP